MKMRPLGLFVVILLVLAACGTEGGGDTTTVATDEPTTADAGQQETTTTTGAAGTTTTGAEGTTTTGADAMEGIHAQETDLGNILVDPEGFTLYIFTQDSGGESACYDACADTWPPVSADTPISPDLDQSMFGSIERTDGTAQLTVNGMPLYLYAPDTNPGDTMGQGVNDVWFVVDIEGNMITASAATEPVSDETEDTGYDYDY